MIAIARLCALWTIATLTWGCLDTDREFRSRQDVKRLVDADDEAAPRLAKKVLVYGKFAIPDLEQASYGATPKQMVRIIDVLRQIGSREALPLLTFWSNTATSPDVRRAAKAAARRLAPTAAR